MSVATQLLTRKAFWDTLKPYMKKWKDTNVMSVTSHLVIYQVSKKHIERVHEKVKKFKCDLCEYTSYTHASLQRHIESFHENLQSYKCDKCQFSTVYKGNFKTHVKLFHENLQLYKCDKCQFSSVHKGNYTKHLKNTHKSNEPFQR